MSGWFGTDKQRQLQAQAEAAEAFIRATPGACQAGRFMGCDDPDRLGWDRIGEFIDRDGICGFRLIPAANAADVRARLAERGCRFDTWDVFLADRATALAASETILSRGAPDGVEELAMPTDPEGDDMARIQALMGEAGVVPFSGSMLAGALGSAMTVAFADRDGSVVAAAHGYLPHNIHSERHAYARGGSVSWRWPRPIGAKVSEPSSTRAWSSAFSAIYRRPTSTSSSPRLTRLHEGWSRLADFVSNQTSCAGLRCPTKVRASPDSAVGD